MELNEITIGNSRDPTRVNMLIFYIMILLSMTSCLNSSWTSTGAVALLMNRSRSVKYDKIYWNLFSAGLEECTMYCMECILHL